MTIEGIVMLDPDAWCCSLFGCRDVPIGPLKLVCLVLDFIPVVGELTWLFFTIAGAGAALYQLRSVIPAPAPPAPPPAA